MTWPTFFRLPEIRNGFNQILYCKNILMGFKIYYGKKNSDGGAVDSILNGDTRTPFPEMEDSHTLFDPNEFLEDSDIEFHVDQILKGNDMKSSKKTKLPRKTSSSSFAEFKQNEHLFNLWHLIGAIGNLCNIVGPFYALYDDFFLRLHSDAKLVFTGMGCMMAWISLVQYLEGNSSYYVLITTLRRSTPRVARFLVGVLPIFLGYAMFGVAFFSTAAETFGTLGDASTTLFSLLNGDSIHDVFDQLYPAHPIISRIYLYSFISIFIYAVLNIFVAIVEDAFFASKAFQLASESEEQRTGKPRPMRLLS